MRIRGGRKFRMHGDIHKSPIARLFFIWRLQQKPSHGYSMIEDLQGMGMLQCKPSTIYALLSELEKDGLVRGHYGKSGERMRKEYEATPKGRRLLKEFKVKKIRGLWRGFVEYLLEK